MANRRSWASWFPIAKHKPMGFCNYQRAAKLPQAVNVNLSPCAGNVRAQSVPDAGANNQTFEDYKNRRGWQPIVDILRGLSAPAAEKIKQSGHDDG